MAPIDDDRIRVVIHEELKSAKIQYKDNCDERHKEVGFVKTMLWGVLGLQFSVLIAIIAVAVKLAGGH